MLEVFLADAGNTMSGGETINESFACAAARCGGTREALAVAVLLYSLTRSAEALAGDPSNAIKDIQPIVGGTPLSLAFVPSKSADEPQFSADEFRVRKPSMPDAPAESDSMYQTPALPSTSAWQRWGDYRSQGRVQLLTLWESNRSTVSLQTGRHGGPSLQWSSRLMGRGGATRGLLDRFVSSSLSAAGLGAKAAHGSSSAAANKSISSLPATKSPN
jgi:hypothetical protein